MLWIHGRSSNHTPITCQQHVEAPQLCDGKFWPRKNDSFLVCSFIFGNNQKSVGDKLHGGERRLTNKQNLMLCQKIANHQGGMIWDNIMIRTPVYRLQQIPSLHENVKIPQAFRHSKNYLVSLVVKLRYFITKECRIPNNKRIEIKTVRFQNDLRSRINLLRSVSLKTFHQKKVDRLHKSTR